VATPLMPLVIRAAQKAETLSNAVDNAKKT
jgi:hypothetical protein